jgi:uncharacterized OB-fold protein
MYCTNCGSIVSENDNYCSICGKSISKVSINDKTIAFYKSVIDFKYTKVDSKGQLYGEKKYLENIIRSVCHMCGNSKFQIVYTAN